MSIEDRRNPESSATHGLSPIENSLVGAQALIGEVLTFSTMEEGQYGISVLGACVTALALRRLWEQRL